MDDTPLDEALERRSQRPSERAMRWIEGSMGARAKLTIIGVAFSIFAALATIAPYGWAQISGAVHTQDDIKLIRPLAGKVDGVQQRLDAHETRLLSIENFEARSEQNQSAILRVLQRMEGEIRKRR